MCIVAYGLGMTFGENGGVVFHTQDPQAEDPWATREKPFGDTVVKPADYFWENEWTGQEIPDTDFPMTHEEALAKGVYHGKLAELNVPVSPKAEINPTPRRLEILRILASAKHRLSNPRLFCAMEEAKLDISEHTLRIELAKMRRAEWVDNDQSRNPRGYAITDEGRLVLKTASLEAL
jgi:hypothetical protein